MSPKTLVSRPIAALILLSAFLFFFRIGERSFRNPDEGRYAEIAREMVVSNNWIEPTLYGVDYLRKPALFYWLLAFSFKVFGQNEFAARLVPVIFGLFGILATYFFAKRYFGKEKAFFAALILATNFFYIAVSRYLLIDAVFAFFLICAFYLAYLALEEQRPIYGMALYGSLALAFLTKGVAGIAIPAFVILIYLALVRQLKVGIAKLLSVKGIFIFLAVALPWFIAVSIHQPDFLGFFFWHEHISRYFSANFEHQEPWFFYLMFLPLVFFPWSLFVSPIKSALRPMANEAKNPGLYLQVIFFGTLLFYSISKSKLLTYLLPLIPLGAILIGGACMDWIEKKDPAAKSRRKFLFYAAIIFLSVVSILVIFVMESLNSNYTTKHFAQGLKPGLTDGDKVFIYGQPSGLYDFAFYLNRPVKLVGLEGELEFNRADYRLGKGEIRQAVIMPDEWKQLVKKEKIYCLMRRSDYHELEDAVRLHLNVLMQDDRKVLLESTP